MNKELSKDAKNANSANLTAVDYFHDEINKLLPKKIITTNDIGLIWVKAKEMEKQQTMDFALKYMMQSKPIVDYYNETYGGSEQ